MKLHENSDLFKETVTLTAAHYGLNPSQVEKDYWTTEILRMLSSSEYKDNIYFAGGTSLMKAHRVISRFSEDLDLYIDTNDPSSGQNAENNLNSKVYNKLINTYPQFKSELSNTATGGTRRIHFETNKLFTPVDIKNHLLIELSISTTKRKAKTFHPWVVCSINSLVMEYLEQANKKLASSYENTSFRCKCMSPKETICAKISRLTRTSREPESFATNIRDLYDITKLMGKQEYIDYVNSEEFLEAMFRTNMQDWLQHKRIHTQKKYCDSNLFADTESLLANTIVTNAYSDMQHLLFKGETLPPIRDVFEIIQNFKKRMSDFDRLNESRKDEYVQAEFNNYFTKHPNDCIVIVKYEFLESSGKVSGRICQIKKGTKHRTLAIDYKTGDISITKSLVERNTINIAKWETIDGFPAGFINNRIMSMKHIKQIQSQIS